MKLSKLPPTTLTRLLEEMVTKGLINEAGFGRSSGGRPPVMYKATANAAYIVGIDISRRQTKVVLVDMAFRVVAQKVFGLTIEQQPAAAISAMKNVIQELMQECNIHADHLLGIGIGAVGPLNREEGVILTSRSQSTDSWNRIEIIRELQKDFPLDIIVENGANTAALAEYKRNTISNENLLYCISGIGLRCGIITNGHLMQNRTGNISSQGHMVIDPKGKKCSCGKRGCWVAYTSLVSLLDETRRIKEMKTDYGYSDFLNSLKEQDPAAEQAVQESVLYFGIGLSNMINMFHPKSVIMNGPIFDAYPEYFDEVVRSTKEHLTLFDDSEVHFSRGGLKEEAVSVGAAQLLFDSYFVQPA
ncbi:ROK family protein [Planococcus lenghuensis]|nr:ROK family protein [Planococcus lenghuensis]